jgi:hypothetical protein
VEAAPEPSSPTGESKIQRGWRLTQVAWRLIRQDRTLLALALAGIAAASVFSALFLFLSGYFSSEQHSGIELTLLGFVAFYISTLLSVFFNVALACAASAAFDGEEMDGREALRMAWGKRRQILLWSLISSLVGTLRAAFRAAANWPSGSPTAPGRW